MNNVSGIIYAYHGYSELYELGAWRTGASMPFYGRYRLIDFSLSSMMNAGIQNVGVIMQKGYQSLLDHIGNGRTWDMDIFKKGLRPLPPFGLPEAKGLYEGNVEALASVRTHLENLKEEYVILARGDLAANLDLDALVKQHIDSGVDVTAVCTNNLLPYVHHSLTVGRDGFADQLLCLQTAGTDDGYALLEVYMMRTKLLLELVDWCSERGRIHFNRDALMHVFNTGGKVGVYLQEGYARHIESVADYYEANMDMLVKEKRKQMFPSERQVYTPAYIDVSTYYGDDASVKNSVVADGCIIEGTVENCILFGGVKVGANCVLKNSIILNDTDVGEGSELTCVIADKNITVSPHTSLKGSDRLPLVIPKGKSI